MFKLHEITEITDELFGRTVTPGELRCICFDDESDEKRLRTIIELMKINKAIEGEVN